MPKATPASTEATPFGTSEDTTSTSTPIVINETTTDTNGNGAILNVDADNKDADAPEPQVQPSTDKEPETVETTAEVKAEEHGGDVRSLDVITGKIGEEVTAPAPTPEPEPQRPPYVGKVEAVKEASQIGVAGPQYRTDITDQTR
jgi:hypothetical protein